MSLTLFLNSLFHGGRGRVHNVFDRGGRLLEPDPTDLAAAVTFLEDFEAQYRIELPFEPPPFTQPSMIWGAKQIHRACSLLAYREVDEAGVRRALDQPCPEVPSPSVVYSVDLTFRFLPDILRLARAASSDDPLVQILQSWARQWPLSSVGIANVGDVEISTFIEDRCLRQLYVDRIIAEQDESRLTDARTREAALATIGLHSRLSPKLAARLTTE